MSEHKRGTNETGAAGVFAVCAQLAQRGWFASPTLGNTPRTDILAQVGDSLRPAAIQVKTKSEHSKDFRPSVSGYSAPDANEWAILVALSEDDVADFFVMPRDHLVAAVRAFDNTKGGQTFLGPQEFESYRGNWDLLEEPSWKADWGMLRDWIRDNTDDSTWPSGREPFPLG